MFNKDKIDLELATEALKGHLNSYGYVKNNIQKIQKIVAEEYQINVDDMKSKKRTNNIAFPRQVAMYLIRELTDSSLPQIGRYFGNRHHTTVKYACEKIENDIKTDETLKNVILTLKEEIKE